MIEKKLMEKFHLAVEKMDEAIKARAEGNNKETVMRVWEVGAILEYFIFLMRFYKNLDKEKNIDEKFPRRIDIDSEMSTVQKLLRETSSITDDDLEVLRIVWRARGHILRIQGALERATL